MKSHNNAHGPNDVGRVAGPLTVRDPKSDMEECLMTYGMISYAIRWLKSATVHASKRQMEGAGIVECRKIEGMVYYAFGSADAEDVVSDLEAS